MSLKKDSFDLFTKAYVKGNFLQALQSIISNPEISYDAIHSKVSILPYLINYADSCVSNPIRTTLECHSILQDAIECDPILFESYKDFLSILKLEYNFLTNSHYNLFIPEIFKKQYNQNENIKSNLNKLIKNSNFSLNKSFTYPKNSFSYPKEVFNKNIIHSEGEAPLIFLEPIEGLDYSDILNIYKNQSILFVFESMTHLWHHLQFDSLIPFLCNPLSDIYILEMHPSLQSIQNYQSFKVITLTENKVIQEAIPYITKGLIERNLDTLYFIAKRLMACIQTNKYGKSRCFALNKFNAFQNWHDPYKPQLTQGIDTGPLPHNFMNQVLSEYKTDQKKSVYKPKSKIKLAHITAQIVDGGHAPSRLLRTLIKHSNKDLFELNVISTEADPLNRSLEYPISHYGSESSKIRGKETIQTLEKKGIKVFTLSDFRSYKGTALLVNEILEKLNIDAVIFHGPDEINSISSCSCNVPLSILFEHGTLVPSPGFDIAVMSSQENLDKYQKELDQFKIKGFALPFCIDCREFWEKDPYPNEKINLPENAFIMTTISNHLDNRLTDEMCHAIGKILQRSKGAFYAPIGNINNPKRCLKIFEFYGVANKVIFLGQVPYPSQYARSMDLYLNEFPFGSGIGILDAMASGCPVVSMYDENGPPQAIYGGAYFGKERVITSGNVEDYIDIACRLIDDRGFYQEWSQFALEEYEKHANVGEYVFEFERIIQESLKT